MASMAGGRGRSVSKAMTGAVPSHWASNVGLYKRDGSSVCHPCLFPNSLVLPPRCRQLVDGYYPGTPYNTLSMFSFAELRIIAVISLLDAFFVGAPHRSMLFDSNTFVPSRWL